MFGNDHRAPLPLQAGNLVVEAGDGLLIQIGGGLVQHEDVRAHGVDRAKGQQLLLPTGEGENALPAEALQPQGLHGLRNPGADLFRRASRVLQPKGQLAVRVQIEKLGLGILEYRSHLSGQLVHGRLGGVQAAHLHPSLQAAAGGKGRDQAVDELGHRSLSTAGGTAQQDTFARTDSGVQAGQGLPGAVITKGNILK